ncbi:MAG: hypothetical protein HF962_03495 [Sulfurovum sp.]|nr:hypothetical protein [Sulfurovum sp.]
MRNLMMMCLAVVAGLFILSGCGGGGNPPSEENPEKVTGYLIDSAIAGISYDCNGSEAGAVTASDGAFECYSPPVTFKLGGMTLGTIQTLPSDSKVYLQDLLGVDRSAFTDPKVVKLARLLQSLDENNDLSDGITITAEVAANFTASDSMNHDLSDLVIKGNPQAALVSEESAIRHLQQSLNNNHPHPGETEAEVIARYLKDIQATNRDLNTSDPVISTALAELAKCLYRKDKTLLQADIIATFGSHVREEDLNSTNYSTVEGCDTVTIRKVGGTFTDSQKVLYYTINNPVTGNEQLLAYDYDNKKSQVVNTDVILGHKVFLFEGEKDGGKEKFTGKKFGVYLDPNQNFKDRTHTVNSRYGSYDINYRFYMDNALMKFDVKNPSRVSYVFRSNQIPAELKNSGVSKVGKAFKILENIVDPDNSYVGLKVLDSLADDIRGETEDNKTQAGLTVRVGDSKAVAGTPIAIIKDTDFKSDGLLVLYAPPYIPEQSNGTYTLKKYNASLTTSTTIANGKYYFATENDTHIYLFKEGSDKIYAFGKSADTLTEVAGVTLAGAYSRDVHAKGSSHGSSTRLIDGGTTLSGRRPHLGSGDDAYVSFHYDLHANIGSAFIFGSFGAYKSAQVFKLTGTTGIKIMDNGDAVDHSSAPTTEPISGHINLIAVSGNKLLSEIGWFDGNATLGGTCRRGYPMPFSMNGKACVHVKYGYVETNTTSSADDITVLEFDDNNASTDDSMVTKNLPYYVARRIGPVAVGDKLYISLFKGGSRRNGYVHQQYQFQLSDMSKVKTVVGRTYFTKTHQANNGIYDGTVIAFSQTQQTIFNVDDNTELADVSDINGKPGFSISALTSGAPLSGVGSLSMLKNNIGNHAFEMFVVDTENGGFEYIDFAPFGGWIYE